MVSIGNVLFRNRNWIFPSLLVFVLLASRPIIFRGNEQLDRLLDFGGLGLALLGQLLRALSIGLAYIKRGGKNKHVYAESLVREGIFAHCRNPLYLGNVLIISGLAVIYNSTLFYLVAIPGSLLAYLCIIAAEEAFLREKFGEKYDVYCREVNRFIPSLRGFGRTLKAMPFDWRRFMRKDYGSVFYWVSCAIGLIAWEGIYNFGFEPKRAELTWLTALWAAAFAAWAIARVLKKKRLIGVG